MLKNILVLPLAMLMLGTVLFSAIFIFIFSNSVDMTCQRQPDRTFKCIIEKRLFGRLTTSSRTISQVTGARTEESCDNDGCSYRTDLIRKSGANTPFNDVYTDNAPVVALTDQINADMQKSSGAAFAVDDPAQLWVILLIGGLAIMGLTIEGGLMLALLFKGLMGRR